LILTGQLLLADEGRCRIEPGVVRVADGYIAEVSIGDIGRAADFGGPRSLICPGFIDCHLHLPQFNSIGAHGQALLNWLRNVILPNEARWEDISFAQAMTDGAINLLLRSGTTGIAAYTTLHHRSTLAALTLAQRRGIRAWIGQSLMDCDSHAPYRMETARMIDEAHQTVAHFPPGRRVSAAVTPRYALGCTDQLLQACGSLAGESGSLIQTHLAENEAECAAVRERFGCDYLKVYDSFGLVTRRSILGHGIYLDRTNMERLAETAAIIAHCPTANEFLHSGTMRWAEMINRHVPVCLGSDIGAGYETSMVRVARAMISSAVRLGGTVPDASQAFYAITCGNAQALGWSNYGVLREGAEADLLLIEPDGDWLESSVAPLSRLLFSWNDHWIRRVWLGGRPVV
jgi:guanine deaminase